MGKKVEYAPSLAKVHKRTGVTSAFGRSYYYITCPHCGQECKAFLWSISGGGKKCPGCGAMHDVYGTSTPIK